jgi:hypothetical protein
MVQMRLSLVDLADHAKRAGALKRLHSTASSSSDWGRLSSKEKAGRQAEGRAAFEASEEGRRYAATPAGQWASLTPDELEAELVSNLKALLHAANKDGFSSKLEISTWSTKDLGNKMRLHRDVLSGNDQNKREEHIQHLKGCASRIGWASLTSEEKGRLQAEGQAAYDASPDSRDWNKLFQGLLAEVLPTPHKQEENKRELQRLEDDFQHRATNLAKDIIWQLVTQGAVSADTAAGAGVGGQAGGVKFSRDGIFFKLSKDTLLGGGKTLYGGEANAAKAASHEFRSLKLILVQLLPQLHVPLLSLVHYLGCTCLCMSTLPLAPGSLVYGSDNAGQTVHADNSCLNELMEVLCVDKLNLRPHPKGGKMMHAAVDVEGHHAQDGMFYVLDAGKCF